MANRVRILNNTTEPRTPLLVTLQPWFPHLPLTDRTHHFPNLVEAIHFSLNYSRVDQDNILPDTIRSQFRQVLQTDDEVFNPTIVGYSGTAGPVQASVNMGPVQPPQRKGRVP